jgi:LSD1 subclass zinc finger protein
MSVQRYPCESCGAQLEFDPGTASLKCAFCGHSQAIPASIEEIQELDFRQYRELARLDSSKEIDKVLHCNGCAAEFTVGPYDESQSCPFCGSNVVVPAEPEERVAPKSLVPFHIKPKEARASYDVWVGKRFWAPLDLAKKARAHNSLHGIYVPYWTYDSVTTTWYQGMRGEHYYVQVSYRDANGNEQTRTERRTHWYPASGVVVVPFDDVLVLATERLPDKYTRRMQKWSLEGLTPYEPGYLSGFQAMRYDIDLEKGFTQAQDQMDPVIHRAICQDIGGDEQQVTSRKTQYDQVTFKHMLLPIYSGAYQYKGKPFRFFINGQTGHVAGEAPVSWWKVTLAVLLGLAALALIAFLIAQDQGR